METEETSNQDAETDAPLEAFDLDLRAQYTADGRTERRSGQS
jgi:hypothetical protein